MYYSDVSGIRFTYIYLTSIYFELCSTLQPPVYDGFLGKRPRRKKRHVMCIQECACFLSGKPSSQTLAHCVQGFPHKKRLFNFRTELHHSIWEDATILSLLFIIIILMFKKKLFNWALLWKLQKIVCQARPPTLGSSSWWEAPRNPQEALHQPNKNKIWCVFEGHKKAYIDTAYSTYTAQ